VIVPAYQAAGFIRNTLDSILAQTFQDFELIVINDGSPDTEELERVLEPYRNRIIYVVQENQGLAGARNAGIRAARGEFIAPLDADDLWAPDHLAVQISALRADPSIDMIYADARVFGDVPEAGRTLMELSPSQGEVTLERLVTRECVVNVCVCVIRKEILIRAGLFDATLRRTEDIDMWLRIAMHGGRITNHRQVLGFYLRRPGSLSSDFRAMFESYMGVLSKIAQSPLLSTAQRNVVERQIPRERARMEAELGKQAFLSGDSAAAIRHLKRANEAQNSARIALVLLLLRISPGFAKALYSWRHRNIAASLHREPSLPADK
jgi:hypothetical protein